MNKINELDPDFIRELLKSKGLDLDDVAMKSSGVNERLQILGAGLKLMSAWDKFDLELYRTKNEFHKSLIDVVTLLYDAITNLADKDGPVIETEVALKVKSILEKFQEEIKTKN